MQTGQEQDQQHQAVLAAIVRQGQLPQGVSRQRGLDHGERDAGLVLHAGEERVGGIGFFGQEGVHATVEVGHDDTEGRGVAVVAVVATG